jgi:hypothetical protein
MKVTIDVDCSPEEARRFLGLPDVAPMQEVILDQLQGQMLKASAAMDPESIFKTVFPMGTEALTGFQKMFWDQFMGKGLSK